LDMSLNPNLASQLFPNLTRHFCPLQSAILLGMSRLVGVECPGLQSIFSELRLVETNTGDLKGIKYHVAEFEDRYGLTLIAVSAPGLNGKITAFLRPVPQAQADYSIFKKLVKEDEFAGQRALIVGGSRGLGEVAAKLLAAGGADVQLTYHLGKDDAQKVTNDIISVGGHASNFSLDILQSKKDLVGAAVPTHLYYFASPIISGSGKSKFSPSLFKSYCDYYVNGFAEIVENLQRLGLRNVFYPSTVFINEMPPNFLEYVMVKNAGEVLCQGLAMKYPEMYFHCPRLPKMATDQTVSFTPSQNPTPAPIVLTALQNFRNLTPQRL